MTSRREFLRRSAISAIGLSLPSPPRGWLFTVEEAPPPGFLDLRRPPDGIRAQTATGDRRLRAVAGGGGRWEAADLAGIISDIPGALRVELAAPAIPGPRLQRRWGGPPGRTPL